jgi:hypothetical protein
LDTEYLRSKRREHDWFRMLVVWSLLDIEVAMQTLGYIDDHKLYLKQILTAFHFGLDLMARIYEC